MHLAGDSDSSSSSASPVGMCCYWRRPGTSQAFLLDRFWRGAPGGAAAWSWGVAVKIGRPLRVNT
eukprot:2545198-Alexandrium_andersonii.AAC.1